MEQIEAAKFFCIQQSGSHPDADTEYWLLYSPFDIDNKYYVFASCRFAGGGWPKKPVYLLSRRPERFAED